MRLSKSRILSKQDNDSSSKLRSVCLCFGLQRVSEAEGQLSDEQAKVMKLEVTVAEQQQQLDRMEELEKELQHHRSVSRFEMLQNDISCSVIALDACITQVLHGRIQPS